MAKKAFKFDKLVEQAEKQNRQSLEYIRDNIVIEEQFKHFIPPLAEDEFRQLEDNIRKEGCRDALIVWERNGKYILIDGHNRYQICTTYNLPFRVQLIDFADEEAAKDWMINNQLGKRNVTEETKAYLRGLQYKQEKRKVGGTGSNQFQKTGEGERTAERLAEQHQVSEKTIRSDEKFAEALDKLTQGNEQLKWDLLNKRIKFSKLQLISLADQDELLAAMGNYIASGSTFAEAYRKAKEIPLPAALSTPTTPSAEATHIKNQIVKLLGKAVKTKDKTALTQAKTLIDSLESLL
ncbi:MAG: ParB N-terminal domain-containing protein [Cytophagales bacterium]|nr:ParB N-terminal domain-containing protein [Cytophagales bacterium]